MCSCSESTALAEITRQSFTPIHFKLDSVSATSEERLTDTNKMFKVGSCSPNAFLKGSEQVPFTIRKELST